MRFKVGDRVRIKSLDWYNENKDCIGCLVCGESHINSDMEYMLGKVATISAIDGNHYRIKEYGWNWTDEMIEGLAEDETKPKFKVGDKIKLKSTLLNDIFGVIGYEPEGYRITNISNGLMYFMSYSIEHCYELVEEEVGLVDNFSSRWVNEFDLPEGYIFKDENGNVINATKIVLEKKKSKYPTSYAECCKIIEVPYIKNYVAGYKNGLLDNFQKLLICRDAYWKIAGEKMGLGKPWEPDWTDYEHKKFVFIVEGNTLIEKEYSIQRCTLAFPTAEMRDAFYENFKSEIEMCKELL